MGPTVALTCAREFLPPVIRRWLSALPADEALAALSPPDLVPVDAILPVSAPLIGAIVLGRLVMRGHAAHAPEGFRARALRIAAAVEAAPGRFLALTHRPPRTRVKLEQQLFADLTGRVATVLEEAEAYAPRPPGPAA